MVFALFRAASRAGAVLVDLALMRGAERETIVSLASNTPWRAFAAGERTPWVLHHADRGFGLSGGR
jgi:hypothetical protein